MLLNFRDGVADVRDVGAPFGLCLGATLLVSGVCCFTKSSISGRRSCVGGRPLRAETSVLVASSPTTGRPFACILIASLRQGGHDVDGQSMGHNITGVHVDDQRHSTRPRSTGRSGRSDDDDWKQSQQLIVCLRTQ